MREVEAILASFQSDQAITLQVLLNQMGVQSLDELAKSRAPERAKWEHEWKRKSYPKSTIPVLEKDEKEQILANRARELSTSIQHLNDHRLLLITGMPGIGKSKLARTLLEFMPSESPPPFWYNFERQQSSGNTLGILLDRISGYLEKILGSEVREEILSFRNSPEHQASSYDVDILIDALNQPTPLWLIFDNFEAALSKGGEHLIPRMIRGVAGCEGGCPSDAKSFIREGFGNFNLSYVEGGILKAEHPLDNGERLQIKVFPEFD